MLIRPGYAGAKLEMAVKPRAGKDLSENLRGQTPNLQVPSVQEQREVSLRLPWPEKPWIPVSLRLKMVEDD